MTEEYIGYSTRRDAYDDYLEHHGILGQKWGVRRYQNDDRTLTDAGKKRYSKDLYKQTKKDWVKVHNNVAKRSGEEFAKVNNDPKFKDSVYDWKNPSKKEIEYLEAINKVWKKAYEEEADKVFGKNPMYKETREYVLANLPTYGEYDRMLASFRKRIKDL